MLELWESHINAQIQKGLRGLLQPQLKEHPERWKTNGLMSRHGCGTVMLPTNLIALHRLDFLPSHPPLRKGRSSAEGKGGSRQGATPLFGHSGLGYPEQASTFPTPLINQVS